MSISGSKYIFSSSDVCDSTHQLIYSTVPFSLKFLSHLHYLCVSIQQFLVHILGLYWSPQPWAWRQSLVCQDFQNQFKEGIAIIVDIVRRHTIVWCIDALSYDFLSHDSKGKLSVTTIKMLLILMFFTGREYSNNITKPLRLLL